MKKFSVASVTLVLAVTCAASAPVRAATTATMSDYTSIPPFIGEAVPPLVMMLIGRDHKLYYEAYNDASDLDGDGVLDVGYKHSIDYYGYFDPYKCYTYTTSGTDRFVPSSITADKYCSGASEWSGNFLNWLTTSRMDALRKVLYGGYRSTDSSSSTVLEGAFIPQDAHSWGKELYGAEADDLTPFPATSATGGTLPSSAASWSRSQEILMVTYDDSVSGVYGDNHSQLLSSYQTCQYSSYGYVNDFNDSSLDPTVDHGLTTGNLILVAEFQVTSSTAGTWTFAIDGDDGVEVEVNGTVVASYYGGHGPCGCQDHNGTIDLSTPGWYRLIVRHRENSGWEGVRLWYKRPGLSVWTVFGTESAVNVPIRAPDVPTDETIRFMVSSFIETGEPGYGGDTITCVTSRHLFCVTSLSDGATPVIRVLQNKTNRVWEWASKERPVCDTSLGTPTDYYVRVEVCNSSVGEESNCRSYPNSPPKKPEGLFQKYGESTQQVCSKTFSSCNTDSDCGSTSDDVCIDKGQMFFGLASGSYTRNLSGGVIRWNIDAITHDVDNRNVGIIQNQGILKTLNNLKVTGFSYSSKAYQDNCGWITTRPLSEGECRMWGNPMGELLYETMRYFAGKSAPVSEYAAGTADTGTDDKDLGLPNQSDADNTSANSNAWVDPYNKFPSCSKPFVIMLSDVSPSYDSDQLPGSYFGSFSGDLTGLDVATLTNTIGSQEGITGSNIFIGQSGTDSDTLCTSKAVSNFGQVRGLCPEEPTKRGTYYTAAVANYGKTLFGTNNGGRPNVTTFSVALQSPVPEISVDAGGNTVKIIPIGKSVSGCLSTYGACAAKCTLSYDSATGMTISNCSSDAYCPSNQIVDFYVDTIGSSSGKFRVNFEDVEQGADHDMDAIAKYEYSVSGNNVTVTVDSSVYASGCIDQVLGFVISGTTEDGVYLPVRDQDSGSADGDTPSTVSSMPMTWSKTFTASSSSSSATLLKDPLWYAAKWGGFEDQNDNNIPDLDAEWDSDGDGTPDTYFLVTNPLKLEQQLTAVFAEILKRSASGTSVSILATSAEGEGALYQSYFYPEKVLSDGSTRKWLGFTRGFFLDVYGNLREDTNGDNKLVFSDDKIVQLRLDTATNEVKADLFTDADEDGSPDTSTPASTVSVDSLSTLWEAGEKLAEATKSDRNIYTWVDIDGDGTVDNGDFSNLGGEALAVTTANAATLAPYLNAADTTEAQNIINYTRGNAVSGYRNRCVPITGATLETGCTNATERVWALGDIVYSTPTTVASPSENYDLIYGLSSYSSFKSAYLNRRHIVYVGGNDGLLHALNAGVYTAGDDSSTPSVTEHGSFAANPSSGNGWTSPLPELGDELWAFAPYDNLPHLKWFADTSYSHVYGVDLKPKATDVRIFCDSDSSLNPPTGSDCVDGQNTSHPGGWGTILIVGQRFGGGAITVTGDYDNNASTPDTSRTFRSAYYALDVTDPEKPPRLLWRFTDSALGFTTAYPAVVHVKDSSADKWYMIVGSGPDNEVPSGSRGYDGSSNQQGKIFVVNLLDGSLARTFSTDNNAFMGDATAIDGDVDDNYTTDTIYIGSSYDKTGNPVEWTWGKVYRITTGGDSNPANWTLSTLISLGEQPMLVGPSVSTDPLGNKWVFFGTGRYLSTTDKTNSDQQTFYAIKDACWDGSCTTTYAKNDLMDSTNIVVKNDYGSTTQVQNVPGSTGDVSYGTLITTARTYDGWYVDLTDTGSSPSERVLSKAAVLGGIVLFTAFTPNNDVCALQGSSVLYALYYETGTAYIKSVIGTETSGGTEIVSSKTSLGSGVPTTVGLAVGKSTKGFIQTSTGTIIEVEAETRGERSGTAGWREESGSGESEVEIIYKYILK
ncbi:MAG TPA: pilus assembly protein PilY [Deltaproteobacteria bacterium]|nr:pilus assembly protein PilY [Deltaproteobacteria bacterium]